MTHWVSPSKDGFKYRHQASFEFVAAPWPPNERQIKAVIYLELSVVIPGSRWRAPRNGG
jgi:hypothetical protein